jgi:hypothetical protein
LAEAQKHRAATIGRILSIVGSPPPAALAILRAGRTGRKTTVFGATGLRTVRLVATLVASTDFFRMHGEQRT